METRDQFIAKRAAYHEAVLREQMAEQYVPEHVYAMWAKDRAERDWKRTRVYDKPIEVHAGAAWCHDHREAGVTLRINPDGPMTNIMELSFGELRELVMAGYHFLLERGEWPLDDEHLIDGRAPGTDDSPVIGEEPPRAEP